MKISENPDFSLNALKPYEKRKIDAYFSVDVETDGPIPGPYSMLSFALVYAGSFDGQKFIKPKTYDTFFYKELKPISDKYQQEALEVNGLDRSSLILEGSDPKKALIEASDWIKKVSGDFQPVMVAYPLSFDWVWLYWYFENFLENKSPFGYSHCFDIKTAVSIKRGVPISSSGRSKLPKSLKSMHPHTHNAIDDAISQAEIFSNIFELDCHEANKSKKKI